MPRSASWLTPQLPRRVCCAVCDIGAYASSRDDLLADSDISGLHCHAIGGTAQLALRDSITIAATWCAAIELPGIARPEGCCYSCRLPLRLSAGHRRLRRPRWGTAGHGAEPGRSCSAQRYSAPPAADPTGDAGRRPRRKLPGTT